MAIASVLDPARDKVGIREGNRSGQFDDAHRIHVRVDQFLFVRLAAAWRTARKIIIGNDAGPDIAGAIEHVQFELCRDRLADLQTANTVSVFVEAR